jgi:hypothetical protein
MSSLPPALDVAPSVPGPSSALWPSSCIPSNPNRDATNDSTPCRSALSGPCSSERGFCAHPCPFLPSAPTCLASPQLPPIGHAPQPTAQHCSCQQRCACGSCDSAKPCPHQRWAWRSGLWRPQWPCPCGMRCSSSRSGQAQRCFRPGTCSHAAVPAPLIMSGWKAASEAAAAEAATREVCGFGAFSAVLGSPLCLEVAGICRPPKCTRQLRQGQRS